MPLNETIRKNRTEVIADEILSIRGVKAEADTEEALQRFALNQNLSALCLSGGGIRSAAFCLGVIQRLAKEGLLSGFDYLSSVSGGGYIGSWLQVLLRRFGVEETQQRLRRSVPPREIGELRAYTDYLMPAGSGSLDAWTNAVLYLRNVLLTWGLFLPLLLLPVIAAVIYRTSIWSLGGSPALQHWILAIGAASLAGGTLAGCWLLPDHRRQDGPELPSYAQPGTILGWAAGPLVLWAFLTPLSQGHALGVPAEMELPVWAAPVATAAAVLTGYALAWCIAHRFDRNARLFWQNLPAWLAATIISCGIVLVGSYLAKSLTDQQAQWLAVLGPLWLLGATGAHAAVFVGVRRVSGYFELDREWLARLSAFKLRVGATWAILALCCLSFTYVLHAGLPVPDWVSLGSTLAAGSAAAWFGKQAESKVGTLLSKSDQQPWMRTLLLDLGAGIFLLGLLALLGMAADGALAWMQGIVGKYLLHLPPHRVLDIYRNEYVDLYESPGLLVAVQICALAILGAIVVFLNHYVNPNRYSMQAVYRNRLSRAFLGSARGSERAPDPFTNLDPAENIVMSALAAQGAPRKLFPLINITLNLTAGGATAWSERKAMAFTISPLACGAPLLRSDGDRGDRDLDSQGVYVSTAYYAGKDSKADRNNAGISLATAMAVSGAAVSPNWGYHSSPLTAFVMAMFNMRLGVWLPNPAVVTRPDELALAKPRAALVSLLGDLLGNTRDTGPAIYLSDGGHFENLGLYEALRRRCRFILVVDAGQDDNCQFEDLGNAIRKVFIDMNITVRFSKPPPICGRGDKDMLAKATGWAWGEVTFPESDQKSHILYVKPCLIHGTPQDVLAYANGHITFPHETTLDQFFTESQFESYRALGEFQMAQVIEQAAPERTDGFGLVDLFEQAARVDP